MGIFSDECYLVFGSVSYLSGAAGRVVEVAVDVIFVLVIRVLWAEQGLPINVDFGISLGARGGGVTYRTYRTGKVVRVKLFVCVRVSEYVCHDEQDPLRMPMPGGG